MRSTQRFFFILLHIICCTSVAFSAQSVDNKYIFRQVNSKSGLSDNNTRNLLMLANGSMVLYSPTMLSLYDGISYMDKNFNSTFVPYKEYSTDVELISTTDDKIIILNGDRTWYFDNKTLSFCYHDDELFGLPLSSIKSIIFANGNYFIYTKDGKFQRYNSTNKTTTSIQAPSALEGDVRIAKYKNNIYILSRSGALMRYDAHLNTFTNIITDLIEDNLKEVSRLDIEISSDGNIWIMHDDKIRCIDAESFTAKHTISAPIGYQSIFTSIALDSKERLWVGTSKSDLSIINIKNGERQAIKIEVIGDEKISNQVGISNIYTDPKGGVWIATESEGVLYYHEDMYRLKTINNRVEHEDTKCMTTDKDGNILLGTSNGLYSYDPLRDMVTMPYAQFINEDCISLYRDRQDRIWLGTFRNGAYCIDKGKIRNFSYPDMPTIEESYHALTPNFNCIRAMLEDSNGDFWVSVYGGLARFDTDSGQISLLSREFAEIAHVMFVRDLIQVGDLIFASSNDGYFTYNIKENDLNVYPSNSDLSNKCNQAIVDNQGAIWIATAMGLRVITPDNQSQLITTRDGLPSNNIIAVAQDNLSNIWAINSSDASRISILSRENSAGGGRYKLSITSFSASDGLDAGILIPKSITTDKKGSIYIGGSHGFSIIEPSKLYQRKDNNPPILTNLYINNTPISVEQEYNDRVVLHQGISTTKEIVLNHDESFISFDFSNLNYINPSHTLYRYQLEGFDAEWKQINSKESARATYTLLTPGNYKFKVVAANNGTDWDKRGIVLSIVVKPPFYKTTFAYVVYFLLTILLMIFLLHLFNARNLERLMQREQMEREQINQMKFRFFTNISHELRTPLSLILLPLSNIIRKTPKESDITPQLLTIERNASHLLSLVNHLLDFRKLEMGGEKLTLTQNNPSEMVEAIISDFSNSAAEKNITLKMDDMLEKKLFYFDMSHINKVFNNLISNAIKFTPEGGCVTITLRHTTEDYLVIEVSDTGVGISKDDQALIFERFYQVKDQELHLTGSGIGLHLVKQYVELHKGALSVESQLGVGSTFRVELPNIKPQKEHDELDQESIEEQELILSENLGDLSEKFKILIVEDNTDFREYLAMELESLNYEIYTAVDGEDGINKARAIHPSLILSDIMMPKSDGFTLCTTLKNDINTSHIPIILLTARTADDVRYEGYKAGADAYISKPFSFDVLEIRIRKLIEERQHRYEKIKSPQQIQTSQITVSSLDEKLMAQIIEHIEKNMSNADYSVEQLSRDVAMHRMNLYRKIQSIAGMTPSEFLRTMRIKRAAQLLEQDSSLAIVEVSEMVGFNTPKYFTNYFRKMYGVTPSVYVAELKNRGLEKNEIE